MKAIEKNKVLVNIIRGEDEYKGLKEVLPEIMGKDTTFENLTIAELLSFIENNIDKINQYISL